MVVVTMKAFKPPNFFKDAFLMPADEWQ